MMQPTHSGVEVTPKKVRVSSLMSSDHLLSNNNNNTNDGGSSSSIEDRDGPPSVIATYSRSDSTPFEGEYETSTRYLIDAIGDDDDESGTLIDSEPSTLGLEQANNDDSSIDTSSDTSVDDTELDPEEDVVEEQQVEVTIETLGDGLVPPNDDGQEAAPIAAPDPQVNGDLVRESTATRVKSLINTLGVPVKDIPEDPAAFLPVMKALLYVLIIPVCSFVLKQATFVTRDICLDLHEKGLMENLFLLHLMVALNAFFSIAVFLVIVAIVLDPSRLSRFAASLDDVERR